KILQTKTRTATLTPFSLPQILQPPTSTLLPYTTLFRSFRESVLFLHRPPPDVDAASLEERTHPAWRRLKFDELLAQQLAMRIAYRERRAKTAPALPDAHTLTNALVKSLPFALTRAQRKAHAAIAKDLAKPHPMRRL